MPTILVHQDNSVQYSPAQSCSYRLNPNFRDKKKEGSEFIREELKETKDDIVLVGSKTEYCHNLFIRDKKRNNCYALHVTPQSLDAHYDPAGRTAKTHVLGGDKRYGGLFDASLDVALSNIYKPAYTDLRSSQYSDQNVGIADDSELEVCFVVNKQYWNKEKATDRLLSLLKQRCPGRILKINVIVTSALDFNKNYEVAWNTNDNSLSIQSGLYVEKYTNAFESDKPNNLKVLPPEQKASLQTSLGEALENAGFIENMIPTDLGYDFKLPNNRALEMLVLNLPLEIAGEFKTNTDKIRQCIDSLIVFIPQMNIENIGIDSYLNFHAILCKLYLASGNTEKFLDFAERSAQLYDMPYYDVTKSYFCALAGAANEKMGNFDKAYFWYEKGKHHELGIDQFDSQIRLARVAIKSEKISEALETLIDTKNRINESLKNDDDLERYGAEFLQNRKQICETMIADHFDYLRDHQNDSEGFAKEFEILNRMRSGLRGA